MFGCQSPPLQPTNLLAMPIRDCAGWTCASCPETSTSTSTSTSTNTDDDGKPAARQARLASKSQTRDPELGKGFGRPSRGGAVREASRRGWSTTTAGGAAVPPRVRREPGWAWMAGWSGCQDVSPGTTRLCGTPEELEPQGSTTRRSFAHLANGGSISHAPRGAMRRRHRAWDARGQRALPSCPFSLLFPISLTPPDDRCSIHRPSLAHCCHRHQATWDCPGPPTSLESASGLGRKERPLSQPHLQRTCVFVCCEIPSPRLTSLLRTLVSTTRLVCPSSTLARGSRQPRPSCPAPRKGNKTGLSCVLSSLSHTASSPTATGHTANNALCLHGRASPICSSFFFSRLTLGPAKGS